MPAPAEREAGSTLLLVPAAVVILLLLGALLLDGAAAFLAQRQLADACTGAANDAVTASLALGRLYGGGRDAPLVVDAGRAADLAHARAAPLAARWGAPVEVTADPTPEGVALRLEAEAPRPLGLLGSRRVRVRASCEAADVRR